MLLKFFDTNEITGEFFSRYISHKMPKTNRTVIGRQKDGNDLEKAYTACSV